MRPTSARAAVGLELAAVPGLSTTPPKAKAQALDGGSFLRARRALCLDSHGSSERQTGWSPFTMLWCEDPFTRTLPPVCLRGDD